MIAPQEPGSPASAPVTDPISAETNRSMMSTNPVAATDTAAVSRSLGMASKIGRRRAAFLYQPASSVEVREDELLAREWGCKPGTAHQRKLQAMKDTVDVILAKRRAAAHDSLAGYCLPLESAMAAYPLPDALHREAVTDAEEDLLQEAYRTNPCELSARHLLRKRAAMRQAALDCDREIAARYGIAL